MAGTAMSLSWINPSPALSVDRRLQGIKDEAVHGVGAELLANDARAKTSITKATSTNPVQMLT